MLLKKEPKSCNTVLELQFKFHIQWYRMYSGELIVEGIEVRFVEGERVGRIQILEETRDCNEIRNLHMI